MVTITNFGGGIARFYLDTRKSSLAAGWLVWKAFASYMIQNKAKGNTAPAQKQATL